MPQNVIMPKTGMAMEEGTVVRWLKKVGDAVSKGEAVAVIETDKVTMDLESDYEGTLLEIVHGDGTVVKATDTIAWIGAPGEKVPAVTARAASAPASASASASAFAPASASAPAPQAPAAVPRLPQPCRQAERSPRLPRHASSRRSPASPCLPWRGPAPAAPCSCGTCSRRHR